MKAINAGYRDIVNKGSARSSKTVSIIQNLDFHTNFSGRHKKVSIVSQSFPHLKDGVIYEYKKYQMRDGIVRNHNKGDHEFHVGKSIINYFSLGDDNSRAIGPGREILYLNEPNKGITFQDYTDLKTRTTEFVIMDYNPSSEFWLHTEGILEDPRTKLIHSTWLDNIRNLTKAQIDDFIKWKLLSKTSDFWAYYWKVYGLGEDAVLLEERIMPFIKWVKAVPEGAVEIPSALDFGFFPDPTTFLRLWIRKGALKDDLYIQQIVYDTRLSINTKGEGAKNLVDILLQKGVNPNHLTIAESADANAVEEMRLAKFAIEKVVKTSVETSIRLFHDYNIHIVEGSDQAFTEFDNYRYKRDKKNIILPIPAPGQADHTIDAVRYVLLSRNKRWSL